MQFSAVQYTLQYSSAQCSTVHYGAVQCSTVQYSGCIAILEHVCVMIPRLTWLQSTVSVTYNTNIIVLSTLLHYCLHYSSTTLLHYYNTTLLQYYITTSLLRGEQSPDYCIGRYGTKHSIFYSAVYTIHSIMYNIQSLL